MGGGLFGEMGTAVNMMGALAKPSQPAEFGQIIRWREGEILGIGSSAVVYSAINLKNNSIIAVKKFKIVSDVSGVDPTKLKLVKNEIQRYKQLNHPNILQFHGCELLDQYFCLYLEQCQSSLANVLSEYGPFPEEKVCLYTWQILQGLSFLHA